MFVGSSSGFLLLYFSVPRLTFYIRHDTDGDIIHFLIRIWTNSCRGVVNTHGPEKKTSLHAQCNIDIQFAVRL